MKELLKRLVPFELKRSTSLISIVVALVLTGFLAKLGEVVFSWILDGLSVTLPPLGARLYALLFYDFTINVLTVILVLITFPLLLFPLYRYVDRLLLNKRTEELIFEETFIEGTGWNLNYWGTTNLQKTNRIENSQMIFEATRGELVDNSGFFGAFYDLRSGIYQGNKYRVTCSAKSIVGTTMAFQLWIHDTAGIPQEPDGKAIAISPPAPTVPSLKGEQVQCDFTATNTNAMRIHLHCRGGSGQIIIEAVRVHKL